MDVDVFLAAACDLLAVKSTAEHPGELLRALEFVLDFVGPGFTVEQFESAGKPSVLVYAAATRPRFDVILNCHLDVVPAAAEQFRPRLENDRLYARGAQDMKVSALVQALVFRELAASVPYSLGLQLVTDEEAGGRHGTYYQLLQGVTGAFVLIGETSGLHIVSESKGVIQVRLRSTGRSAHGAYPWLGDNAILRLVRTVDAIISAFPVPSEETWRTTVNVARITTPNRQVNQIPALANAWLDIRFPAGDPQFDGKNAEQVCDYLGRFCDPEVIPSIDRMEPPHHADENCAEIIRLRQAARDQGYSGAFLRKHGTADARYYGMHGINAVSFGTGGGGQHGPGEYVSISTIAPYYRALASFVRDSSALGGEDQA